MGDIDLPPGTSFPDITEDDVLSKVVPGSIRGTKGCNPCHGDGGNLYDYQLSQPIDPFGKFLGVIDLAPFVIDTNEPGKTVDPSVRESLAEICSCVESSRELAKDQTLDRQLILHLCERLSEKTSRE